MKQELPNLEKILSELIQKYYKSSYELEISPEEIEGAMGEIHDLKTLAVKYEKFMELRDTIEQIFDAR